MVCCHAVSSLILGLLVASALLPPTLSTAIRKSLDRMMKECSAPTLTAARLPNMICVADLNEYKSQLLARIYEESMGAAEEDGEAVIETDDDDGVRDSPAHRTNFASSSLGASIMAANPEMTGPKSLLVGDVDAYALSRCDAKKFVVIQLSEDVLVDELVISNEERYSSAVRELRATGSQKYPATEWVVLGNFTAENRLGEQKFPVASKTFVRFLKLTWLSHYGAEFYCTWTRVQVRGD